MNSLACSASWNSLPRSHDGANSDPSSFPTAQLGHALNQTAMLVVTCPASTHMYSRHACKSSSNDADRSCLRFLLSHVIAHEEKHDPCKSEEGGAGKS